ncbi:uncharacterized protein EHS24_006036 [Apiotrichum porosum]|uniref:Complex 1 LYR protein domain-containing protein n=1 Tax=Apiotrichum porosum TaxID=105984 RepID=A0A427Y063_9TREE|nr:uncharacterized protein EHS24_006036 [Apiotrichum porosum]RSH84514.1 hypothetical protein EHS24_006036 [Apiotrichum porosum]
MSALRRLQPFVRRASTAATVQPTPAVAPTAPAAAAAAAEALPPIEELRARAKKVYKELHRLGRDYPDAEYNFNMRLRRAFEKNSKIEDPAQLKKQLDLADHIKKEVLAMFALRKYRHLRRSYHADEPPRVLEDHFHSVENGAPAPAAPAQAQTPPNASS